MSVVATVRPPGTPTDPGRVIDAVLERLRWTVQTFRDEILTAGTERRGTGEGIHFSYVADGAVVLRGAADQPLRMQAGDFVLVPRGTRMVTRAAVDSRLLSGTLGLRGPIGIRLDAMPPVLFACGFRLREPTYAVLLEAMAAEVARNGRGGSIGNRIVDVVASAAIRTWLESGCTGARAWVASMADPHLARAIEAIHDDPGSPWTVATLARLARSSRSQFAEQFKDSVGDTPARYLTRVRMERAEQMLSAGASVTEVAFRLGYQSDAGFSRAFRRSTGVVPSLWRRAAGAGVAPTSAPAPLEADVGASA